MDSLFLGLILSASSKPGKSQGVHGWLELILWSFCEMQSGTGAEANGLSGSLFKENIGNTYHGKTRLTLVALPARALRGIEVNCTLYVRCFLAYFSPVVLCA